MLSILLNYCLVLYYAENSSYLAIFFSSLKYSIFRPRLSHGFAIKIDIIFSEFFGKKSKLTGNIFRKIEWSNKIDSPILIERR